MSVDRNRILSIARSSKIRAYKWKNRGRAPAGYVDGMSVAFAEAYEGLLAGDEVSATLAAAVSDDTDHDVLDWYAEKLEKVGLTSQDAPQRMVGVFTVMLGLGMRESSGQHCEGRDMSATNVSAATAEAGLFQVSYNSAGAHPLLKPLFARFSGRDDLLNIFADGVQCSAGSWSDWGEGPGRDFQALTKRCPKFAVLYAGVLLRHARKHWGPINRREAEVTADAATLFQALRSEMDQA